jgi:hypothetical protein
LVRGKARKNTEKFAVEKGMQEITLETLYDAKATTANSSIPFKFVILTMDTHLVSATERAYTQLLKVLPGLELKIHSASNFSNDVKSLKQCLDDIASANIIVSDNAIY